MFVDVVLNLYSNIGFIGIVIIDHKLLFTDLEDPLVHSTVAQAYGLGVNESFGLNNFDYRSDELTNIFIKHIENTSFYGLTVSSHAPIVTSEVPLFLTGNIAHFPAQQGGLISGSFTNTMYVVNVLTCTSHLRKVTIC